MTPEQALKKKLKAVIKNEYGGYWISVQGGAYSKAGEPDIVCCIDGRFVGVEAKTPTGILRPIQAIRGMEITKAGGIYLVIRSEDGLRRELNGHGFKRKDGNGEGDRACV